MKNISSKKVLTMASQFIYVEGTKRVSYEVIHATVASSKHKTFVCVPGLGDLRQEYRYLAPLLHDHGNNTVISMDLRGMGDSDVNFASYTPDDTGRDIIALLNELDLNQCILIGCSMTAASVVYAAAGCPSRVAGVVMISPFLWDHAMPFGMTTLLHLLLNRLIGPGFWASYYKSLYTLKTKPVADLNDYVSSLKRNLNQSGRLAALRGHLFGSKALCTAKTSDICKLEIPVFAVYGNKDPDFASCDEEIRQLRSYLGHVSSPIVIEGCGHYPHVEQPENVSESIKRFISSS